MLANINVSRISSTVIAVIVGLSLGAAAAGNVVGDVVASQHASVNGITVPGEWTVASGDALTTAAGGNALVHLSTSAQARLSENTSVVFQRNLDQVSARLSSGTLDIKEGGKDNLVIKTDELTVEAARPGKSEYVVAMLGDRTVVSARSGDVTITEAGTGQRHLISQGHYGTISQAPGSSPGSAAPGASSQSGILHNKPLMIAIVVGAGVGIGFAVGEGVLGSSPASPSQP